MAFRFLFYFLLFFSFSSQALALEVRDVRFGLHGEKTRMVLDLNAPTDFSAFVLPEPYRLVVDLPQFSWRVKRMGQPESAGVIAVRHGVLKPGVSRIVFDLNRPVGVQNAFMLPSGSGKSDRLVIDFANVSAGMFTKVKGQRYGTFDINNVVVRADKHSNDEHDLGARRGVPKPVSKPRIKSIVKKHTVIIDPGHGGIDPGAVSKALGLHEKDIALKIAKSLKAELQATGRYHVKMTRENDRFIKLRDRVRFARKHEGDLFISIHADSINKPNVSGASVYTLSEKASDAQTARLAARENKADLIAGIDLSVEDEDVVNILMDLARRDTMNQSKFFAGKLVEAFPKQGVELLERPHRYAGFAVLKAPDIPSVLVEAGFISNIKEAKRLNTKSYRQKVVRGLKRGVDAYFDQVLKNQRE